MCLHEPIYRIAMCLDNLISKSCYHSESVFILKLHEFGSSAVYRQQYPSLASVIIIPVKP